MTILTEAELQAMRDWFRGPGTEQFQTGDVIAALFDHIASLRDQLKSAQRDAERYRWLRDWSGDDDFCNARLNFKTAPMFDAAIDTLMILHDPSRDSSNYPENIR